MSILRTFIGGGIFAGLLAAAVRFPLAAAFVALELAGGGLLFAAYLGVQSGSITARRSRYQRGASPFGFWFYVGFYSFLGALGCSGGAACLLRLLSWQW